MRSKRFFIFLIGILAYCASNAQTLYWVGGSGNFNDPHHWSLAANGLPGNLIPNAASNLVFPATNLNTELKVIFNASSEINSLSITTYDKIRFVHNVPGIRLRMKNGFENLSDNENFKSEITFEFKNSSQTIPGIINTGNSPLSADLIISSGNWKVVQIKLDEKSGLYVQKASVNFYKSVIDVGSLDLSDCISLDFYHSILKAHGETRVKNCKEVSFKRAYLNGKFYDDSKLNHDIYALAGRGSQNQTNSVCIPNPTVLPATCAPGCDGSVIITLPPLTCYTPSASGSYNIIVDGSSCPGSPSSLIGVGPGTYTLTNFCGCPTPYIFYIQDANGDLESTSAFVPLPAIFTNISSGGTSTILCNGACTGSVNLNYNNLGGNSAPYSFTVTPPGLPAFTTSSSGSLQLTGLCAGTLTVTTRDVINCTHTFIRNFVQPAALNTNSVLSNIRCNGPCTGSLTISPTGGVANYVVKFNPGGTFTVTPAGTATTSGLCVGPVSATLTDSRSCSVTVTANITQPPAITLTVNQKSLTCSGVCEGAATITAVGGVGPYTITLMPSVGPSTITASATGIVTPTTLCAGNYTASVVDFNNCVMVQTFSIATPPALTVTPTFTDVTCFGGSNGAVVIATTGGNGGPYSYTWSPVPPSGQGTQTITGLVKNDYTVNISYGSSCTGSLVVSINQPPQITLTVLSQTISCFGVCNGGATVTAAGGNGGYTFNWNPAPPAGQGTATISSLCGGTSFVATVSDASLCVYPTVTVSVTQASSITPNIIPSNLTCGSACNGSITASPTGTASFNYTLASTTSTITTSPPYTGLCAGTYTVFMRDLSTSCTQSSVTPITAPSPLLGTLVTTSLNCFNQCTGTATATASGGTAGYTISIATPTGIVAGNFLTGLCIGDYTLHITDANGCTNNTVVASVTQPTADILVTINSTSMTCASVNNGVLNANITGGTPGYTLAWSNSTGANPNTNLGAGNYTLVVTDALGCIKSETSAIAAPLPLSLSQFTSPVSCAGGSDGSATITASGGIPSYTFQFNNTPPTVNTTGIVSGLAQGNYIASVNDANGCNQAITFTISAPSALSAVITGTQNSCNVCIGAATVQAAGGTQPYTYAWTNSLSASVGTGSVVSNLCPGNYTVTVTGGLCTVTQTINIAQVVTINLAVTGTSIQCFGQCTGSAVAVPSGGGGAYSFSWTPSAQTTATATSLCVGVHNVTVTDAVGCVSSRSVDIQQPLVLGITTSKTDATCSGTCNGLITTTVTGGTGAISYTWTPGPVNTSSLINVCAGNYDLIIRDANSCTLTIPTISVTQNPSVSITFTASPSACANNNGSICATVSGGSGSGYTYSWSPVAGNASCLTSLSAGSYTLLGGDGAGCTNSITAIVINPTGPSLAPVTRSVTCFGGNNGSATVTASGVSPFSFTWTPAVTFSTVGTSSTSASGLVTGTYVVLATDGNMCVTSQTVGITQATSLTANQSVSDAKCNGGNSGSITVAPSGGTPAYTFSWSPPGLTGAGTATVTGLTTGTYAVIIGDAVPSCTTAFTFSVSQPPALALTFTRTNVRCNSACNGSIVANATGGTGAISYSWPPVGTFTGATTATVVNLCPAIYTVIATDLNLCTISTTILVTQPTAITSTLILKNATCSNSCNAVATHSVVGGVPGYTYTWSSSVATTTAISGLCAGIYTATVMDANSCVIAKVFTVTPPPPFTASLVPSHPKCNAACNGSITTTLSGAQGTVSFNWQPTGSGQNPTGLCFNTYTVTATDDSLCVASGVTTLINPPAMLANISTTNASCAAACNGTVNITPSNAVGAVTYVYSPFIGTLPNLTNVCAGNYSVQLTDANNCLANGTFTLIDPPVLNANASTVPSTCTFSNGSISVLAVGGTPGYTFTWQAPVVSTNSVANNLPAGIYTVIVTDSKNCTNTITIPLSNSNGPSFAPVVSTSINCNGQCTGAASVNVAGITGGTPGYTVTWVMPPAPSTLNPLTNLCAGNYSAQVTDANNCVLFVGVSILEPPAILLAPSFGLPTCNGICDGSISLNPTGGVGPTYSFTWFPVGPNAPVLTNACAGSYNILIGDNGNNCIYSQTVVLPAQLNISASTSVIPNQCFGDCNATATAFSVTGGVAPYAFSWSNGQVGPVATNLCNGVHSVIITDGNGCFNTFTVNVSSGSPITSTVTITTPSCNLCNGGSNIVASGGSGNFSFLWTTGSTLTTLSGLCAGVYQVLITDLTIGCTRTENVIINNSNGITGETVNVKNLSCLGTCDGGATVTAIGGTSPITYNWITPSTTNSVITNLCAGTYFVQMSDAAGCLRTASVVINPLNPLILTSFANPPSCGLPNGSISVAITGGTPGYSVSWNPPVGLTATVTNVGQGSYTITVTESGPNSCALSQQINLSSGTGPTVTATQSNINCFNDCTGSITLTATSPFPITYNWSVGGNSPTVTNLCKGVVTVTVTSNNCSTIRSYTITDNPPVQAAVPQITQPSCNLCNGAAILDVFGGTWPYTYTWTTGANTSSVSGLCAGLYQVNIKDALGCSQSQNIIINNSTGITGQTFSVQGLPCNGACNGSASVTALGGNPPIVYNWVAPAVTNSVITNLCSGDYFVQMTDAQGCIRTASVTVASVTNLSITPTIIPPACNQPNGSISVLISGGTPSYNVSWSPVANTTPTLSGITQGSYTVTVTESGPNNCSLAQQINVSNTTGPTVTATQTDIDCFNACTGAVTATATGAAPLTYQWSVGGTQPTVTNLCNGVVTLSVTDGNGCVTIRSFTITQNAPILIGVPVVSQPSCNLCNGSAAVSASGGMLPYTYTWTTGAIGTSATNLCAGLYQVDITDALGCRQVQNVIVNNSNGITGQTFSVQGLPCAGTCIGSVTVAAVGGNAPVAYNWINPAVSNSVITNLCAGDYFVQMVDAQGCIRTASASIDPVTNLSVSPTVIPPGCGQPNGAISIVVTGGTPTYSISWAPVANNTATLSGIGQGSYMVTVTDSGPNNCTTTQQINLNSVTGPLVVATQTDVACFNACTGVITVTATGTAPLTYNWSVGGNSPTVSNLCKGVVTLTVTDGSNCVTIRSFTITESPQILLGVSQLTQPNCNMCNGAAVVNAIGGTLPYTYTWTTGASGTSVTSLCAGLYQVDVTDALGCTQTQNVIINNSNGITGQTFNVQGLPCAGNCVGSVTVAAVGGSSPIAYNWINPAISNPVISNLCSGSYFVQMVDAQGCIRTASVAIAPVTNLSVSPSVIPPGCGLPNGSIILAIAGGTPAYNISWAPVANSTPTLSGIFQGSYTVTVTESGPNNCSVSQQINLNSTTGPLVTATQTDVACFNACTGVITVTATGTAPLSYNWSVGGNSPTVSDLCKGVVTLTVTDGSNCVTIRSFTITDNPQIVLGVSQITQPSCNMCNGAALVNAIGGTLPYTYTWTTGVSGPSVTSLCAGLYQVDVTDALGCTQTQNVIINSSNGITGQTFSVQGLPCNGTCVGSVSVSAVGGNPPIVYNWVNPAVTGTVISNLCSGAYFVQMSDVQGCIRTASVAIAAVTNLSITPAIVQPGCNLPNGSIIVGISGGTPAYNISWSPGSSTTATLSGIPQGSYTVTVTESGPNNCSLSQQINLSNFTGPVVTAVQTDISCFGTCSGSITASAVGAGPFSFNWSVGGNTPGITNLCPGVITLSVTDFNNCVTIRNFTITENPPLLVNSPQITTPGCNICNGVATVNAFGGSIPYTYVWTTGASGQSVSNLCAGLYQVLITDNLGCQKTQNIIINNTAGINSETFNVTNEICAGSCDGSATVTALGGLAPITYTWMNPPVTGQVINNLCGGDYFVQMTDANGCIRTASVLVNSATTLSLTPQIHLPSCAASNGSVNVNVTGGALPYTYTWLPSGNTSSLTGIGAGSYTLIVIDNNGAGCTKTQVVNISSFNAPSVTFTQTNINCFNACTGSIAAVASGTASPFTYSWSSGASVATATGLCKGLVTLTVTAANGCIAVRSFSLTDNPEFELSVPNIVKPDCFGSCNGSITMIPSGGSLPYTFSWLPSGSGNPLTSLCAGTYSATITDSKGCVNTSTVALTNPAPISVTATPGNSSCSSVADGSISINISGGTPAYTFTWTGPSAFTSTSQSLFNLLSGNYSLTLSDNAGCKRDTVLTLVTTITITARAGNDTTICSAGSVVLTGTNSAGVAQYNWIMLPGTATVATTANFTPPLSAGSSTYVLLTVSSVPGCFDRDTVVVNTFPEITVDAGPDAIIPVFSNVSIGGNPTSVGAVSLTWTPSFSLSDGSASNPVASNTVDVTYTVTASDANGCTVSDTVRVQLYPEVKISNGFSPNGDGKNDSWIIDYIDQFPDNTVEIYNRWGERLFNSQGYQTPFNGQYRGKDLPVGTYYYIINLNHPAYTKPYTGPLTIFR
ncbi:MAG: gliding motility-associated C-terminal domain-containing protein [Bacteroidota bacterium]